MWAHVSAPPPSLTGARSDLPDELDAIIARGMAKDPLERFPTARELAEACARALGIPVGSTIEQSEVVLGRDQPSQSAPTLLSD